MGLRHLAVIMDGNGRWAKKHHLPRLAGHRAGAESLDRTMHWCKEAGISYLTVYAFSTENWKRSKGEVAGLMKLLSHFIKAKEKELIKNGIAFRVIGRREDLSLKLQKEIAALEEKTKGDLPRYCWDARSGLDCANIGRAADFQFPALAGGVRRVLFY